MSLEIIFIVIAVVFLVLAAFAIPFLIQIRKTARNLALTLETLNQNLPVIMKNLEEITANINRATFTVNRQIDDLALTVGRVRQALGMDGDGDSMRTGGGPLFRAVRVMTAAVKGACVFFEVFRSRR